MDDEFTANKRKEGFTSLQRRGGLEAVHIVRLGGGYHVLSSGGECA